MQRIPAKNIFFLEKKFTFKNFLESQNFVNEVGKISESEGHHPDILFGWGYAKINERKTNEYEVTHPRWRKYEIQSIKIDVDFELSYGKEFKFLNISPYSSIMIAEGSEITVEGKTSIKKQTKMGRNNSFFSYNYFRALNLKLLRKKRK